MNDAMPSWKSAVACTVAAIAGIASIAAGSSRSSASRALAIVCDEGQRRALQHLPGQFDGPLDLLAGVDNLLHESDPVGLGGAELVRSQQVVHRVAPAGALHVPHRRSAERSETTLGLHLAEPSVGCRDDDVPCERDLDPDRERDPLHRGHSRLAQAASESERVDRLRRLCCLAERGVTPGLLAEEQRHLQPGRRVIAGEGQNTDEQVVVVVEPGQRIAQLVRDLRRERVLLLDAVDGHHQDVLVDN